MLQLPPLNAVRAFMAAAEHGSFKKAAEELSVTASAISHQIQTLEHFFDIPLFTRGYRSVTLTTEGSSYFTELKESFLHLKISTQELLSTIQMPSIVIDCAPTFTMHWLLKKLNSFQQAHPEIDVTIRCKTGALPRTSHFDYAIRREPTNFSGFTATKLLTEFCTLVCSPSLPNLHTLNHPKDIKRFKTIHIDYRKDLWPIWMTSANLETHILQDRLEVDYTFMAIQAAEDGLGIVVLPVFLLQEQLKSGRLIIPFKTLMPVSATYYLIHSHKGKTEIQVFQEWLEKTAIEFSLELEHLLYQL